jgi:hypothetical protein
MSLAIPQKERVMEIGKHVQGALEVGGDLRSYMQRKGKSMNMNN